MLRCIRKAAGVLLLTPLCALAFDSVDILSPSTSGRFPAYPSEPVPLRELWGQLGMMYDTNILRRTTGENSDFVTRLGVGARSDTRVIGRQVLYVDGRVDGYVYNKFKEIDNVGYSGIGEWRWEVGNDLAGVIGLSHRAYQANLSEIQIALRDKIKETHLIANGAYRAGPHLRLRAGAESFRFSRPIRAVAESNSVIGTLGAEYVTDLGNTVGLEYRTARGDAPVNELVDPLGQFVNNDYRQRDVALVVAWVVSPQLRLGGNFGRTERRYSELPGRDFTGPTYRGGLHWLPTPKVVLSFEATKHVSSIIDIGAAHVIIKSVSFGPAWAVTAKTNLSARLLRQDLTYEGDPATELGVLPERREILRGMRFGAYWEYDRHVHVTAAFDNGVRESNILGRNFRYNALVGNVRYIF